MENHLIPPTPTEHLFQYQQQHRKNFLPSTETTPEAEPGLPDHIDSHEVPQVDPFTMSALAAAYSGTYNGTAATVVTQTGNSGGTGTDKTPVFSATTPLPQGENVARKSNSRSGNRVFVRVDSRTGYQMPSREAISAYFAGYGPILDCYTPESATNVAFVCFENSETMMHVLSMPQHFVEGVMKAAPRPDYSVNTDRVFVKNVPETATWQDLRLYFQQFGEVTDVYIPKDRVTGQQKRFAFVTFKEVMMARAVLLTETHVIHNQPITVMPAESRPQNKATYGFSMGQVGGEVPSMPGAMPYGLPFGASPYSHPWPGMDQLSAALAPMLAAQMPNSQIGGEASTSEDNPRLVLQGLSSELSQEQIREHFEAFGRVLDVYMPKYNPEICFVTMADQAQLNKALEVTSDTLQIAGHQISNCERAEGRGQGASMGMGFSALQQQQQHYAAAAAAQAAAAAAVAAQGGYPSMSSQHLQMLGLQMGGHSHY